MSRHGDHDGDKLANQADPDFVDELGDAHARKAPGGLLTLEDLDGELRALLADHEVVEHAPSYVYPDDPDAADNPLVLTRHLVIPRGAAAPGVLDALRGGGCRIPQLALDVSRVVGLELAAAATVLEKETGGGQHIWGHDPVDTGGTYTKGGLVTPQNYHAWRRHPTAGWQGVAETQLTYKGYIYAAEKRHPDGASDPATNCHVGFETLAQGIRTQGLRTGFRAYNGSGPAAEKYADDALARLARWRHRLAGAAPAPAPAPRGRPNLRPGATGPLVGALIRFLNDRFPGYADTPIPLLNPALFGPRTAGAVVEFQTRVGIPTAGPVEVGPKTWAALEREGFRG